MPLERAQARQLGTCSQGGGGHEEELEAAFPGPCHLAPRKVIPVSSKRYEWKSAQPDRHLIEVRDVTQSQRTITIRAVEIWHIGLSIGLTTQPAS